MPGPRPARFRPRYPAGVPENPTTGEVFALMSWRDRRLAAICQAGLVEKFVDALVWVDPAGLPLPAGREPARASAGSSGSTASSGAARSSSPAGCPTTSAGTGRTCSACGFAAAASRSSCSARACSGGPSPPASRASAWRCSTPTSRRRSPTSRRPPGAARRSASTASGATSATRIGALGLGLAAQLRRRARCRVLVRRGLDVPVRRACSGGGAKRPIRG